MAKATIARATLGRLPDYLQYIRSSVKEDTVSAAAIARGMHLGEVQVRKDLGLVCDSGRPRIGYETAKLTHAIELALGVDNMTPVIIVGAGKLGRAILEFDGFAEYGIHVVAAFDKDAARLGVTANHKVILCTSKLQEYCRSNDIRIGIIAVPDSQAQAVCRQMIDGGIRVIWNFAPTNLQVPEGILVKNENLALSLAHLKTSAC